MKPQEIVRLKFPEARDEEFVVIKTDDGKILVRTKEEIEKEEKSKGKEKKSE